MSQESHADNEIEQTFGTHYHMAIKLTRRARWCRVRARLESENGIKVNFSSKHGTYYSAYQYVTKEDEHFQVSDGHPLLSSPPATEAATMAKKGTKKRGKSQRQGRKRERYTTFDVVELIRESKIKNRLELINLAVKQQNEGKTVLAEFMANRGTRIVQEALDLATKFDEAPKNLARMQKSCVRSIVVGNGLNVGSIYLREMKSGLQVFVMPYIKLLTSVVENTEMCMYMVHPTRGKRSF